MLMCPGCSTATLRITASLELGADAASDEVSIQALRCTRCGLTAAASYEESRRGGLDSECWNHCAVSVTADDYDKLTTSLKACPDPSRATCSCNAHRWFGRKSQLGRLQPLLFVPCIEGSGFSPEVAGQR